MHFDVKVFFIECVALFKRRLFNSTWTRVVTTTLLDASRDALRDFRSKIIDYYLEKQVCSEYENEQITKIDVFEKKCMYIFQVLF